MKNSFKTRTPGTVLALASLAYVAPSLAASADLYSAINVPATDARPVLNGVPSVGADIEAKAIGGLRCVKTRIVYPGAQSSYACTLSTEGLDAEAIYGSLLLAEQDGRAREENGLPTVGAAVSLKSADGLSCTKVTVVYPGAKPTFSCAISF